MKHLLPLIVLCCAALPALAADDAEMVKARGTPLFADDFNRPDGDSAKDAIGGGWTSNSPWRAKDKKQVAIDDGVMKVTRVPEANHGVAIFHDIAFTDGAVQLRFKLNAGEDLSLDFVDREVKTIHAGHLFNAKMTPKGITLTETKTGGANLEIQDKIAKGKKTPELAKMLKAKTVNFPMEISSDWHTLLVVIEGDVMRATLDSKPIGQLKSEGIAHPSKRMITLGVNKAAWVDDVKAWKLN